MATVIGPNGDGVEVADWWAERNKEQAARLLRVVNRGPVRSIQPASLPHVSSDHPRPQGAFVRFLFQPYVWPEDSETALNAAADQCAEDFKLHDGGATTIRQAANRVFDGGSWVGKSGDAGRAAQFEAASIKDFEAEINRVASGLIRRGAEDVAGIKRHMFEVNKQAHQEAFAFLRSGSGQSLAQLAVVLGAHRATIQGYSSELQGYATQYATQFTNHFKLGGPGGPKFKQAGGRTGDHSPDGADTAPPGDPASGPPPGVAADHSPSGDKIPLVPGGRTVAHSPEANPPPSRYNPLTSLIGGGLPSLPSMPGGGSGGGLPMGPLQGLMGGFGGLPGGMPSPTGLSASGLQGSPMPSLGMDFGRGLAAGAAAAGGVPPVTPAAPMTPLTAPIETAPTSAAPAAAPIPTTPPAATSAPSPAPAAGMPAGGMTSYGSVLPPQGAPAASPVGSPPAAPSVPAEAGGGSPGAGAGLMPVAGRRDVVTVRKEDAWSDLEQAKMWVAELAGAAKVTDPGVDWAVAVGHNASGMPTYWVATNDGATYIPPGVFLRKMMPIAGGHDADFDARWFGWVNPADKAVRAAREFGDTVSAVATSWALPSEYLAEHPTPQVAYGVKPSLEPDNAAAKLSQPRAHRLQTVDAALYADLVAAGESVVRDYCRELVRQLVFGIPGEELSAVAQSVGQALVAGRRPSAAEWALLGEEHQDALVQMACQRPGLNGLENPDQTVSYTREFVRCRQLEALLCWEYYGDDPLNVVYAAWVAGIRAPLAKNGGLTVG